MLTRDSFLSWTFFSAFCADYPDACAAAEEEPVPDQGADVGGPGDVQDRQQGDQAGEGAHSRLQARRCVFSTLRSLFSSLSSPQWWPSDRIAAGSAPK